MASPGSAPGRASKRDGFRPTRTFPEVKFRLAVLGDFRFTGDGCDLVPPPTLAARSLLTYLIWSRGAAASREKLIELFWPESEPERGRSSLSTALWSIRRSLRDGGFEPDDVLEAGRTRIAWLAQASLDAHEFELRASADDWGEQQSALELYRGAFLEGHYDDWSVARREHLDALYQQVLMLAVTRADDVESARRLIERGSFDEEPYALLAQAELALGRHGVAAAIAARCREVLAEVGERPSASFEARFAHVGNVPDRRVFELPFCGREAEFSALGDAFRRAIDGQGGIVVVQGPAGSGKSELLRKATAHPQAHAVNLATVAALDRDPRAFGPWLPLYERMTGKTAADFSSGGGNATTLADAVVDALGTPGMLVVDDAQFLSGDALQVLVRIARRAPHEALQLAIAVRSEGVGTLLPLLPRHRAIALGPISNPDLVRALESIAPANVHAIADFLTARSGGHAFFAAQLFESLIASKALRHESGSWSFDASSDAGRRTPATIGNFIDARLRAKGNDAATVACALALEPSASSADLVEACGSGESATLDAIDDLLALGLIEQPSAGPEFRFGHDLIRERAAHVLNSGRRLALHRSFAKIFEPGKRDLPLQHARHLGASGQMFPAAQSYCKAASELLEVNAWRDAMESATSGLQAIDALAQTRQTHALAYRLHRVMMRSKQEADDYTGLVAHIEAGIERARESREPELICTALLAGAWMIELGIR
jgi:DNA-binding SARP family transcriptional activator